MTEDQDVADYARTVHDVLTRAVLNNVVPYKNDEVGRQMVRDMLIPIIRDYFPTHILSVHVCDCGQTVFALFVNKLYVLEFTVGNPNDHPNHIRGDPNA